MIYKEYEISYELIHHIWMWVVRKGSKVIYATPNKTMMEDWLDLQENKK